MLAYHPDGHKYVSALIVADDDHRCGLCFGVEDAVPIWPEHFHSNHCQVTRPDGETFDLITSRYAACHPFGLSDWWKAPMEVVMQRLRDNGIEIIAHRRVRRVPVGTGADMSSSKSDGAPPESDG